MFEIGDIVECIDGSNIKPQYPQIKEGNKYVIAGAGMCATCGFEYIDIGLTLSEQGHCRCRAINTYRALYHPSRFRKIEPSYRTVEVEKSINKQIKELILS